MEIFTFSFKNFLKFPRCKNFLLHFDEFSNFILNSKENNVNVGLKEPTSIEGER